MTKHKMSQSSERVEEGRVGQIGAGGVEGGVLIERKGPVNPALATVCAFTVCSKGSRHNNLCKPATFEKLKRRVGSADFWVLKSGEEMQVEKEWMEKEREKERK